MWWLRGFARAGLLGGCLGTIAVATLTYFTIMMLVNIAVALLRWKPRACIHVVTCSPFRKVVALVANL